MHVGAAKPVQHLRLGDFKSHITPLNRNARTKNAFTPNPARNEDTHPKAKLLEQRGQASKLPRQGGVHRLLGQGDIGISIDIAEGGS